MSMASIAVISVRGCLWLLLSLVLTLAGYSQAVAQLRLAREPVAVRSQDIDYLQVGGKTYQATIFQPEGTGPFPAILDVHGGAWTREDVRRDEHAHFDMRLLRWVSLLLPSIIGRVLEINIPIRLRTLIMHFAGFEPTR
jgi:hypothetical protein